MDIPGATAPAFRPCATASGRRGTVSVSTTPKAEPIIRVVNLHKSFGPLEVLCGISFDVQAGSVFTLIGASGSGKSTLLRCLNLLEQPTSGEVYLDGQPMGFRIEADGRRIPDTAANISRSGVRTFRTWSASAHTPSRWITFAGTVTS
jgi:ABC-type branched-subunit amino acid transport system ATPase component